MNLETELPSIFRLTDSQQTALKRLGILTVGDLVYYFPTRYGDAQALSYIRDLQPGDQPIIYAEVKNIRARKAWKSKMNMTEATLEESSGEKIKAIWFSQPYISKMLPVGTLARFTGTVNARNGILSLTNPEFEQVREIPIERTGDLFGDDEIVTEQTLYPVYKETKGITSKWIYHHVQTCFEKGLLDHIEDPIPAEILEKYKLPSLSNALVYVHAPKKKSDAEAARKRFAFEEIFFAQLVRQNERHQYEQSGAFVIDATSRNDSSVGPGASGQYNLKLQKFLTSLPFDLTKGQHNAIDNILNDMSSKVPMSRLLEGDVGSGKTIVAATAALAAVTSRPKDQSTGYLQVAYMAPTEILAKQIFSDFCELFGKKGAAMNIQIGLLTSKDCRKFPAKVGDEATSVSKAQLLKWVLNGEIQILVGTHALISKKVFFENLGLVVIDEQHRFGKKQRAALRNKPNEKKSSDSKKKIQSAKTQKKGVTDNDEILPHLLSMTATPIPRTLALTIYGDLDLTVLDELPPGRKKIQTTLVRPDKRDAAYEDIRAELQNGRQAYVICARINDPDPTKETSLRVKSAIGEAERLKKNVFSEYQIGVMHSKLKKDEKDQVMNDFKDGKYDILVSTSVVEVGVNVPNATSIIIEGAERFGLAQLHQLRGRVMRSQYQPYCYLFTDSQTEQTLERLKTLTTAKNGFELAEADLQFRGSGEMLGNKQSGMSDLAMEALQNLKLVEAARDEATVVIKSNSLPEHIAMQQKFNTIQQAVYME